MRSLANPLIYIADNSTVYRKIVKNCLLALNYRNVYCFESIDKFFQNRIAPDILILENSFGKGRMTGMQLMLAHGEKFKDTRFIFLSSNTDLENAVSAIRGGAYDYIVKSKKGLERLVSRIDKLVKSYRTKQKHQRIYRAMVFSLGMFSLLFIVAIILYNNQVF
ncbi:MAG: response regulator [Bacteroidales bacterium]|nr:response regulator [Bacteroidales bacterium]